MTRLPLFRRPGSVAALSASGPALAAVAGALRHAWNISPCGDEHEFAGQLLREVPFVEADAWNQQEIVRAGEAPLARGVLRYWAQNTERYALTRICIVDHPDPLPVLRSLRGWRGLRLLLADQGQEAIAVSAFNEGLLHHVLRKDKAFPGALPAVVAELQDQPDARLEQIWRSTLSSQQHALLRRASLAEPLWTYLRQTLAEYVMLGQPLGAFGLLPSGEAAFVSVHDPQVPLADMHPQDLRAALGLGASAVLADEVRAQGAVIARCWRLGTELPQAPAVGYQPWFDSQRHDVPA